MDKFKTYGVKVLVMTLIAGGIILIYAAGRQPSEELELPGGEVHTGTNPDSQKC